MEKFGAYKIIPHKELIIEYYAGVITVKDLILFKKRIRQDPNYNLYWNTLLDLRDSKVSIKSSEIPQVIDFMKIGYNEALTRNTMFLSSRSNEIALAELYSLLVKGSSLNFNIYNVSSIEAVVLNFCENIIDKQELVTIINDLKTNTNNIY
ncbi:hypothetical protein ES677_14710 [Bizionia gelidisalsuginis]|uniref:Uncharacterized protein n=2 Tax=Bizionia TaxID=283785 RepID=A0A8H2LFG3_9FLAO|nr:MULTISPECIES: hypothetical protein [Bizionia]TYB80348.1 hypothetical protein ES676_01390 [Bizionia saleffrena]TYC07977.1 hypothetical protein ES677_14710 [Bizionia gelidisalsuginis]